MLEYARLVKGDFLRPFSNFFRLDSWKSNLLPLRHVEGNFGPNS